MRICRSIAIILLAVFATTSVAIAAGWQVQRVSQPARYTTDARTWSEITPGMTLPNRSWVHTGKRGRLILRRDLEMIQFKPNTVASITERLEGSDLKTDVKQKYGSILLDVETRATKHTEVETPYIAAVVKGTRFEVEVHSRGADLRVERGTVETTDLARGQRVDVYGGQRVSVPVNPRGPLSVQGVGPKAPVVQVAPVEAAVSPAAGSETRSAAGEGGRGGRSSQASAQDRSRGSVDTDSDGGLFSASAGRQGKALGHDRAAADNDNGKGASKGKAKGKSNGKSNGKAKGKSNGKAKGKDDNKAKGKGKNKGRGKNEGKGKAKGKSNGKAKGHDNGRGAGKSNGGGNGKSNAGGNGNSNAGGNGNGNGNSNAGGNGKGNANGVGNNNAGGNGNGNSGGNGNGNAGKPGPSR